MFYYKSKFIGFAGKTLSWLPSDTEELYKINLEKNYVKLKKYGWIDRQFSYTFNQHGFRCMDFNDNNNIMFLGCSFTQGIGIPIEDSWTSIVAKEVQLQSYNLGIGGSSSSTAFRMFYHWYKILRPSIVVLMTPIKVRFEVIRDETVIDILSSYIDKNIKISTKIGSVMTQTLFVIKQKMYWL